MSGIGLGQFLVFDAVGSVLYGGGLLVLGVVFRDQLDQVLAALVKLGNGGLIAIAGLVPAYIGFKYLQRSRLLRQLRMARLTVDELRRRQLAGEELLILDLRARAELEQDPSIIPGARHIPLDEVEQCESDLPRDRDIILYCSCPNEVSSARLAFRLHRKGLVRVKPLHGGLDAWRERDYPTQQWSAPSAEMQSGVLLGSGAVASTCGGAPGVVMNTPSRIELSRKA
jgi:rhodanese-related sulfurtransferase